jgi:hypothetical protein
LNIPNISTSLNSLSTVRSNHSVRLSRLPALDTPFFQGTDVGSIADEIGHLGALGGEGLILTAEDVRDRVEGVGIVQNVLLVGRGIAGLAKQLRSTSTMIVARSLGRRGRVALGSALRSSMFRLMFKAGWDISKPAGSSSISIVSLKTLTAPSS